MLIETPHPASYSAALLMGTARKQDSTPTMAVVMKAAYDLVENGTAPRHMAIVGDPAWSEIVMADNYTSTHDPAIPPRVAYEADVALAKAKADIVVRGFIAPADSGAGGAIVVNGVSWLTRRAKAPGDSDMAHNRFGFEPRGSKTRQGRAAQYARFASYQRCTADYFTEGTILEELPGQGTVSLYKQPGSGTSGTTPAYALQLPELDYSVRLRVYCGHGPDKPPHWRKVGLGRMQADTLIISPDVHQALILWRCHWPAGLQPADRYRKIQIRKGGF